jgi:hypothetical protein
MEDRSSAAGEIMAEDTGINWGKWVLIGAAATAAVLVAPVVLTGIAGAAQGGSLAEFGAWAGQQGQKLSSALAGVVGHFGAGNPADFTTLPGVGDAIKQTGGAVIDWVAQNKAPAAAALGTAALGGAVLGQWTGNIRRERPAYARRAPGMPHGDYVRARQMQALHEQELREI